MHRKHQSIVCVAAPDAPGATQGPDSLQKAAGISCVFASSDENAFEAVRGLGLQDLEGVDVALIDTAAECPHGNVIGIMRDLAQGVLSCTPEETLKQTIPKLNKVTGMPVLNAEGKVVGVISRKDIIKVRKAKGSMSETVAQHMTSPAITVRLDASVRYAADLMLERKIRRLPVVDEQGRAVGIVSRSDIFKPLFSSAYNLYLEKEREALMDSDDSDAEQATASSSSATSSSGSGSVLCGVTNQPVTWRLKYLYDGDCPMCQSLQTVLARQDNNRGLIRFVNIADPDYSPVSHMGISYDEAMETIHAIRPDGSVIMGTEALKELFDAVGLGWATRISELPIVAKIVDLLYDFLSANRLSLGGTMDGIIAAKRMELSKAGVETCGDLDEGCIAEW